MQSEPPTNGDGGVVLTDQHGVIKRVIFIILGLGALVLPTWDFWSALIPVNIFTPFFAAIAFGGAMIGAFFLRSAIFGDSTEMRVNNGKISLRRQNLLRQRTDDLDEEDVARVEVHTHVWESSADTYCVRVHLKSGVAINSRNFPTQEPAWRLAETVERALGR